VRRPTRVPRALHNAFPHVPQGLQDTAPALVGDVLSRWPTRNAAQRARRTPLAPCCRAPHVRSADGITTRLAALKSAGALPTHDGGSPPHALVGHALVAPRRVPFQGLADCDTASAPRAQEPPAGALCEALPGAGAVCAPRLLVALGAHRARDAAAAARQTEAAMAPVTERRGQQSWGHGRRPWPTCLRHPCGAWAAAATRHACGAQGSSPPPRAKGQAPQAAVRAWACQWRRIRSRCWPERTPSHASGALHALNRRSAPRLHHGAH
jgi:hypothetical protein